LGGKNNKNWGNDSFIFSVLSSLKQRLTSCSPLAKSESPLFLRSLPAKNSFDILFFSFVFWWNWDSCLQSRCSILLE
jgi:hypothetical protein